MNNPFCDCEIRGEGVEWSLRSNKAGLELVIFISELYVNIEFYDALGSLAIMVPLIVEPFLLYVIHSLGEWAVFRLCHTL